MTSIMQQKGTNSALESWMATRTTPTTRPPIHKNHASSTIPVDVDFESVHASHLNLNTFDFNKLGAQRSVVGAQKAKSWVTSNIIEAIVQAKHICSTLQIEEGTLVVTGKYHILIKGAPFWYSSPKPDDESIFLMHVQTVLSADVELHPLEKGIREPP
jgi:hypothetical protein